MAKKDNEISYSQAVKEIEDILSKINDREFDVDKLGSEVKRAAELIKLCRQKLRKVETEVENVLKEDE